MMATEVMEVESGSYWAPFQHIILQQKHLLFRMCTVIMSES